MSGKVRDFKLSKEQKGFMPWFIGLPDNERCARLIGYAGTGKTTVMKELDKVWPEKRSVWCCPSHQAKNILTGKLYKSEAITLASALGLGPVTREAKTIFIPKYRNKIDEKYENVQSSVLVVVDESSMIDLDAWRYLLDTKASKILFVGDPAQIPPVSYSKSPIYDDSLCNYPTYELTQIFRQSEDSGINLVARDTREKGVDSTEIHGIQNIYLTESSISEFYRRYPRGKALCPTHKLKDYCNTIARTQINGGIYPEARYIKGDDLFLESPIDPPYGPTNGSIVTIKSKPELALFNGFYVWQMYVFDSMGVEYPVSTPEDEKERKKIEKYLAALQKEYSTTDVDNRREEINREVDIIANKITFASHGFAMTIHKSQGSTIESVLLCVADLEVFKRQGIHLNMIYTGITRASKNLVIGR